MKQNKLYWIIMADVIASSSFDLKSLNESFKRTTDLLNKEFTNKLISPLTITLGDEFQGICENLKSCTSLIIRLEELLLDQELNFELRYSVVYGSIHTEINTRTAHGMLGNGLRDARKNLENLKKTGSHFFFDLNNKLKSEAMENAFKIFHNQIAKWKSEKDRKMASLFIKHKDYKIISEIVGQTRSQIWKRERSLNISSYFAIKQVINYIAQQ